MRLPPPGNRTVAIAESGLLSAMGFILYLCWYNPVLYVLSIALTPVPTTLLAYRYGGRIGAAGLACTAAAVTLTLGPVDGLIYLGMFGVLGFITGWLLHRTTAPDRLLMGGSLLVFLYDLVAYYGIERLMGFPDSMTPAREMIRGLTDQAAATLPTAFAPVLMGMQRSVDEFLVLPISLFFGVAFTAFVANYIISVTTLRQLGINLPLPPGILLFRLPRRLGLAALAVILGRSLALASPVVAVRVLYLNVSFLAVVFLAAEAWSVMLCVMNMSSLPAGSRLVATLLFFLAFPIWWILGLVDSLFDLRSLALQLGVAG